MRDSADALALFDEQLRVGLEEPRGDATHQAAIAGTTLASP